MKFHSLSACRATLSLKRALREIVSATSVFVAVIACGIPAELGAKPEGSADVETEFTIQPGDQLSISFPGAPDLNTSLTVRRDDIISLPLIGEVRASGKTPKALAAELTELYEPQLVTSEVLVAVLSSQFIYYTEGEVASPGMLSSMRQLSVLEAIVASGGVRKESGKLKAVVVIRRIGDEYHYFKLDLKSVLEGKNNKAFILQPYDIVSVQERFW